MNEKRGGHKKERASVQMRCARAVCGKHKTRAPRERRVCLSIESHTVAMNIHAYRMPRAKAHVYVQTPFGRNSCVCDGNARV